MLQGKSSTPNYKDHRLKLRERADWIRAENAVPALITPEDYCEVTALLKRDMRSVADKEVVNVFSGFLYCADCGQSMVRTSVPAKNRTYFYYVCSGAKGKNGCRPHRIGVEEVENTVFHAIVEQINKVLDLERSVQMIKDDPGAEKRRFGYVAQIEKLREEIERCQNMKLGLYEEYVEGNISREEYASRKKAYDLRIEAVKAELEEAALTSKMLEDLPEEIEVAVKQYSGQDELSNEMAKAFVEAVYVCSNESIEIRWRYGDFWNRDGLSGRDSEK